MSLCRRTRKNSSYSHHTVDDRESHDEIHPSRKSGLRLFPNKSQVVDVSSKINYSKNILDDDDDDEEGPAMHSGASSRNRESTRRERSEGKQEGVPPPRQSSLRSFGGKPQPIVNSHSTRTSSRSITRPTYTEEESDHDEDDSPMCTRPSKPKKGDSGTNRSTRSRCVMDALS